MLLISVKVRLVLSKSIFGQKNMARRTVRKSLLESSKFLLSITKFLL